MLLNGVLTEDMIFPDHQWNIARLNHCECGFVRFATSTGTREEAEQILSGQLFTLNPTPVFPAERLWNAPDESRLSSYECAARYRRIHRRPALHLLLSNRVAELLTCELLGRSI